MHEELVKSAFGISPDTVFGFLVLFMLLVIITLGVVIRYLTKENKSMSLKFVKVIEENTNAILLLRSMIEDDLDPDKKKLKWLELQQYLDQKFKELNRSIGLNK